MKKRFVGVVVFFVVLVVVAVLWMSSRHDEDVVHVASEADALTTLVSQRNDGAFADAYRTAVEAMAANPSNAVFAVEAGELALILRKPVVAGDHMRAAWALGARELAIMLVMVDTHNGTSAEKIALFDELIALLPQTPETLNAKARFYSRVGMHEPALKIWKELCEKDPKESTILQIARKLETTDRRDEAIAYLRMHAEDSHLKIKGQNLYLSLLAFDNQYGQVESLFGSTKVDDPYGEWAFKKAMFSLMVGRIAEAKLALEAMVKAKEDHPLAYAVAHASRVRLSLLRAIVDGADASFDDLAKISIQEVRFFPTRTVTTAVLGMQIGPKQIEGERVLYDCLAAASKGGSLSDARFTRLESLMPHSPVIAWLGIRQALAEGQPSDAVARYAKIGTIYPLERVEGGSGFFYKSPLFIFEAARAFSLNGQPREALTLINHLHERGIYTAESVQLFARLMKKVGGSANVAAMQDALARRFKDDLGIQLTSVSDALAEGDDVRALEILEPLLKKPTVTDGVKMTELMLLLNQGKADLVLSRCEASTLPEKNINLVRARVWIQKGDREQAEGFFKLALDPADDFYGYLDYAKFLVQEKRLDEATALYQEILAKQPQNVVSLQGLAIIDELNGDPTAAIRRLKSVLRIIPEDAYTQSRLAKVLLQAGEPRDALTAANKVLVRDPDNLDASYLQGVAMIQVALEQPVIALRQRKLAEVGQKMKLSAGQTLNPRQVVVHVYLARAFISIEQPESAKTVYQGLLSAVVDWEHAAVKRADIKAALEALNE